MSDNDDPKDTFNVPEEPAAPPDAEVADAPQEESDEPDPFELALGSFREAVLFAIVTNQPRGPA